MTDDTLLRRTCNRGKNIFNSQDEPPRKEYWTFTLINAAIYFTLVITTAVLNGGDPIWRPKPARIYCSVGLLCILHCEPGARVGCNRPAAS